MDDRPGDAEERDDQALLNAMGAGEAEAFDALYYRYRHWVLNLARRLTGQEADALDVLQETFAYLARKGPGMHLTGALTSLLYPVVRHLAIKAGQRRRRFVSDAALPESGSADPSDPTHETLRQVIDRLPEPQREVLLLRFVDDLTLPEIAAAMQVPLGTVKSRLHHALQALRNNPRTRDLLEEGGKR